MTPCVDGDRVGGPELDCDDGPVLFTAGAVARGQVVDFDVTSAVSGDGVYCFALDNPTNDGADYNSREAASGQPALVIGVTP